MHNLTCGGCSVLRSCGVRLLRLPARTVVYGVSTLLGSDESLCNDPACIVKVGMQDCKIHSEEERSVRKPTLRWFSRGREDGGGTEERGDHGWKVDRNYTSGVRIRRRVGPE
jgi:hypothetical protein